MELVKIIERKKIENVDGNKIHNIIMEAKQVFFFVFNVFSMRKKN